MRLRTLALGILLTAVPAVSSAQIGIGVSIRIGPPALPVYVQPPCPVDGYLWTPGYWAYGPDGYYWVPGVWVAPPRPGLLWTPGYWGFAGGVYGWHAGYWGPHVGFYGGVNYGFGFGGVGFVGGAWSGGVFRYNSAVVNVNTTVVRNVYVDKTVVSNTTVVNHSSFNGPGGVAAQPTAQEQAAAREPHVPPTQNQTSHEQAMSRNPRQLASANNGRPPIAAMDKPGGQHFNPRGAAPGQGAAHPNTAPGQGAAHPNAAAKQQPKAAPKPKQAPKKEKPAPERHEKPGA